MTGPHVWVTEDRDEGVRLDVALSRHLDEPRARSQERLAAGLVTVDGVTASKSLRLKGGERIEIRTPELPAPAAPPPPVPVRYADEHLLVVAKPADLVVHPGSGVSEGTLVHALLAMGVPLADGSDEDRPGIVHRLDRGTSGLLVVAKTDEAYRGLVDLLRRRDMERRYWAIVEGVPAQPSATVEAPIARDPQRRTRFRTDPAGRPAVTHYDVEERFPAAARLSLHLETGRTHQVRVHMAAIGHPVAGDLLYGASATMADALGLERPALHSERVAFVHPVTGTQVEVQEPPPEDLHRALISLREQAAT